MTSGYFQQTDAKRPDIDPEDLDPHDDPTTMLDIQDDAHGDLAEYFRTLTRDAYRCYAIANQARQKGIDPETEPEIPFAEDLASRVEALVGPEGIAERIRDLSEEMEREELALTVSKEVAAGRFTTYEGPEEALDAAIRAGLAILTEGILVAPLEGVAEVKVRTNDDGTQYADVYFAGPIRAAGGTGQALSVLIADVVRRELGLSAYQATLSEVERFKEEIPAYKKAVNLQYTPTADEIELIVANLPVGVNGEGTESEEVSGQRDLPRVETNRLRGGACLVIAEGMTLKASKLQKHVNALGLEGWSFLDDYLNKGEDDENTRDEDEKKIKPIDKFIKELTAGRPVLSHPSATGGFRLRYGRARTAGLAQTSIHPALCGLTDDFLAIGTQMKTERPGKGTLVAPCDTIEAPIVRLDDGTVQEVRTYEEAIELRPRVDTVLDLGEMLVPYGEFLENNKPLPPASWCSEWWERLLEDQGVEPPSVPDDAAKPAFRFAERTDTPLHPRFTFFWHDLDPSDVHALAGALQDASWQDGCLRLPLSEPTKEILETLGAGHQVEDDGIVLDARASLPVARGGGYRVDAGELERVIDAAGVDASEGVLGMVSRLAGVTVKAKAGCRIGARMGRPEKAAAREMSPPVHGLFPLGGAGGLQRLIRDAAKKGTIGTTNQRDYNAIEIGARACPACEEVETLFLDCPECGSRTRPVEKSPKARKVPLRDLVDDALDRLGGHKLDANTKGVQGLISKTKIPEPLEKGIMRAKRELYVFKDGTCRYDMTDLALTHFRPGEVGTPVAKLRELGYEEDIEGGALEDADQLVALKPQDVIINEDALDYMAEVAGFVDDELTRLYGIEPFYDLDDPRDLIGHLAVGLAPHTSGGVLCRIVGTTKAAGHWCHPYFHAAKRRNADGDEDPIMLLLDGLINFSRWYLPDRRGGQMDAPLTLSLVVNPEEIDGEAHNVDCGETYPLAFFEATEKMPGPKEVRDLMEIVEDRLGKPAQYGSLAFTHDTSRLDDGPRLSAYKTIDSMKEKMEGQLSLGEKLRAVDAGDVASRVICDHFLPDIQGNLNAFSRQTVRCAKCNAKYRRVPLDGRCTKCRNNLTMTVHEASVKKYVVIAREVSENYAVDTYTKQRLKLIDDQLESLFTNDKVEKAKLSDFL